MRRAPSFRVTSHYEDALKLLSAALRQNPNSAAAHIHLGIALHSLDRPDEAIAHYKNAIDLEPGCAEAHNNIGEALKELGQLDEAARWFARAIELSPRTPGFYLSLAACKQFTRLDPHLRAMEGLAQEQSQSRLPRQEQIRLHFALGKAYADIEQYQRSFEHLLAGNTLHRQWITYDESSALRFIERSGEVFNAELMRREREFGHPSQIPVFIVGMPRSGSTLVEQILASHPEVFGAGELRCFGQGAAGLTKPAGDATAFFDIIPELSGPQLRQLAERYLSTVKTVAPNSERITDKMPDNFRFVGLIHLALPNARIIHTRRDPIDTCLSCFAKLFTGANLGQTYDLGELGRYYRACDALMQHWRRVLPQGVMLDIQYEVLVTDFERQARRIIAHCGLPWDDRCLAFHRNGRAVQTASSTQVRRRIYATSVARWQPYKSFVTPLLEALGPDLVGKSGAVIDTDHGLSR